MRFLFVSLLFLVASGSSFAKSILQTDIDDFNSIFMMAADSDGPSVLSCGKFELREEMIKAVEFAQAGYMRLHKNFPVSDPPIRQQIYERNKIVCRAIQCEERRASGKVCSVDKETGRPLAMWSFDYAVKNMRSRLTKAGIDPDSVSLQKKQMASDASSCGKRAQYYQDAYEQRGRVDDLVCMRKALEREMK